MTESIKATHALVQIGSITVDGFMLTDGAYRMSLTQAIKFVGATEENFQQFLKSNSPEALVWDGYEVETVETVDGVFKAIPLKLVTDFWGHEFQLGNTQAQKLFTFLLLSRFSNESDKEIWRRSVAFCELARAENLDEQENQ